MMNGPRIEPRPPQAMIRPIENSLIFSSARCGTSIRAQTLQMAYWRNIIAESLIRVAEFIGVLASAGPVEEKHERGGRAAPRRGWFDQNCTPQVAVLPWSSRVRRGEISGSLGAHA